MEACKSLLRNSRIAYSASPGYSCLENMSRVQWEKMATQGSFAKLHSSLPIQFYKSGWIKLYFKQFSEYVMDYFVRNTAGQPL